MNLLQASGYRQTHARRAIVEILLAAECALEPMEIFEAGRRAAPGLGLVTVYRTLEKLEDLGLAQRVHQPQGCNRYLRAPAGHEHLIICTICGRAVYFQGMNWMLFLIAWRTRAVLPWRITGCSCLDAVPIVNRALVIRVFSMNSNQILLGGLK